MSTIKSSAEDLTLNADGSGNDVIIQSDGSTKAIITAEGNVGIGVTPSAWYSNATALQISPTGALYNTSNWEDFSIGNNSYYNSSGVESYIQDDAACKIRLTDVGLMDFRVASSGDAGDPISWTTAMAIANNGQVTTVGDLIVGADVQVANGRGIAFTHTVPDGTSVASETLDDYEEGTWTPVFLLGATDNTYHVYESFYTKIGRLVMITCNLQVDATTSGTGNATMTGLPFVSSGSAKGQTFGGNDGMNLGEGMMQFSTDSTIRFYKKPTTTGEYLTGFTNSDINATLAGKYIYFTAWYMTAS